ncbi:sugar phosphate nucleotidyltransferase [Haloglomus irregulare]|uniref:sugar phosphate nucleotidyltransferase n=1 Tax=Haloglomus irregulare TaxID=2234134 RepID=UPI0030B80033
MNVSTGVVLAGGEGRRLRPLTTNRPKPLLPAGNRPILEHVLDTLLEINIQRIIIVVGYRRKRIQQHFGPSYRDTPIEYVTQESELGSGHALLQARNHVSGPFVVLNGDRIIGQEILADVTNTFTERGVPTIAAMEHPEAHTFGAVTLDNGRVTDLVEKPQSGQYQLINAGVYGLTLDIFDTLAETPMHEGELALPTTIGHRIERGDPVYGIQRDALWTDATFP